MRKLPESVQDRLDTLSRRFRHELSERMHEIEKLEASARGGDRASARELRLKIHRLAGTAATFGMDVLSRAAEEAERGVERDLAFLRGDRGISDETVALIVSLRRIATNPTGSLGLETGVAIAPGSIGPPERLVILTGSIAGLPADFDEQLNVFGMVLVRVDEPDEVRAYLEGAPPSPRSETEGDVESLRDDLSAKGVQYCVILGEVSYFSEHPKRLRGIARLREEFPHRIHTVLVGLEDDFETRLRSVRYGADLFIPIPIDVTSLIDKLDATIQAEEAEPYHILVIDDDPEQVSDTALALQNAGMITSVVTDPQNIFRVLVEYKPELILMDMYMPMCNGSELAAIIRQNENFVSIPIVFLSVETDAARQLDAIRSGADDFISKPFNVNHLVTSIRIRASRTRAMRFFMERDSLTGLLNHTNLKQRLEHEMQRSRRIGTELVFAMIDIDKFKNVNDTYGHLTGDRVLKSLARLLVERLRRTDVVGRYGGEEFGVILFNTNAETADRIMNEIRESFSRIRQSSGIEDFTVTFSCGIAEFPQCETAQEINEEADAALYHAKQAGRNRVILAER
ncbi:MAG: diguanylate cyclase [Alkalispirochaeta sp.]